MLTPQKSKHLHQIITKLCVQLAALFLYFFSRSTNCFKNLISFSFTRKVVYLDGFMFSLKLLHDLQLFPLKQRVKPYSHPQQVVVLHDGSPTGILPTVVVIVTDVQPPDVAFPCSQFLRVLCVM